MTQTPTSVPTKVPVGFLAFIAILTLPSLAHAQAGSCADPNINPAIQSITVSPSSIIAWSGVTTLTETLNCNVLADTTVGWGADTMNGGGPAGQIDPANPCGCFPAGTNTGTIQLYSTQVTATSVFQIRGAYGTTRLQTSLTVSPLIPSISLSSNSLIGASDQSALATVTLNGPAIQATGVGVGCPYPGCGPLALSGTGIQIPAGALHSSYNILLIMG